MLDAKQFEASSPLIVSQDALHNLVKFSRCVETRWKRWPGEHIVQRGLIRFATQTLGVLGSGELGIRREGMQ